MNLLSKLNVFVFAIAIAAVASFWTGPATLIASQPVASAPNSNTETLSLTATGTHMLKPLAEHVANADMWDMINQIESMLGPNQSITDIEVTEETFNNGVYTIYFDIEITTIGPPGA